MEWALPWLFAMVQIVHVMDATYQRNKIILISAFITFAVTSALWLGIGGLGYWTITKDSPEFELNVEHPNTVLVGDIFTVKVTVMNDGSDKMKLADLDVYQDLLEGFEVISMDPKPRTTDKIVDYYSHAFSQSIAPGEFFEIRMKLRARDVGLWGGDIDACTPFLNLVTHYTEIEVLDPPPAGSSEE